MCCKTVVKQEESSIKAGVKRERHAIIQEYKHTSGEELAKWAAAAARDRERDSER
jgi:hypothetical protein